MTQKIKHQVRSAQQQEKEQKNQNRFFLVMSFLFLLVLLISLVVPVYYIPLFRNISGRYGLSVDIARKLTLIDLALNSFGIETPNMASAFQKYQAEYEPDVFYTSRFNTAEAGANRLINAKVTYYHEYERTHKRPAEIAGIYQDKTAVSVPEIDGDLKGVRALPKGDSFTDFEDDGFTDFSYKRATARTQNQDEVMGSKRRQVRGSFDRDGQNAQGQVNASQKPEPLPDFASSVYKSDGDEGEVQTLENSRMVKPIVSGPDFSVVKPEGVISQLIGDSSFTDTFAALRNFGGYDGALGYYVKDDLPSLNLIDFLGNTGRDMFSSYFYSHASVSRKYIESSKHLSEIAFNGDEPQDKVLIAKDQKQDKVPTLDPAEMSPLTLVLTVKRNMKECEQGRQRYEERVVSIRRAFERHKKRLTDISAGVTPFEGLENVAKNGAPGSCRIQNVLGVTLGEKTAKLRDKWNSIVDDMKSQCERLDNISEEYASSCKMVYSRDQHKDTCDSLNALKVNGGSSNFQFLHGEPFCRRDVQWSDFSPSATFRGCISRGDCVEKAEKLFQAIEDNIQLDVQPGFVFVD